MPETPDQLGHEHNHRWIFLRKGNHVGAFFFYSANRHFVWTYDPRTPPPCMHYYEYKSRELGLERLAEMLKISQNNGFTVRWQGIPNNAALS